MTIKLVLRYNQTKEQTTTLSVAPISGYICGLFSDIATSNKGALIFNPESSDDVAHDATIYAVCANIDKGEIEVSQLSLARFDMGIASLFLSGSGVIRLDADVVSRWTAPIVPSELDFARKFRCDINNTTAVVGALLPSCYITSVRLNKPYSLTDEIHGENGVLVAGVSFFHTPKHKLTLTWRTMDIRYQVQL